MVIACGLGAGFLPGAPGTFGSLLAVLVWWWALMPLHWAAQLVAIAVVTMVGTWVIGRVQSRYQVQDPGAIVIDEFAGQWIVLLGAPANGPVALLAFLLFRLFDIGKPWPVRTLERRVGGAFGVMIDDLAAGLLGYVVLQFTLWGYHAI